MITTRKADFDRTRSEVERINLSYEERRKRFQQKQIYSIFNPGHLYILQQRQRAVISMLRKEGFQSLNETSILEIGCGYGGVLREFLSFGASLKMVLGVDLLRWRVEQAKREMPSLPVVQADGQRLPYRENSFDIVVQFTVFTSILENSMKQAIAEEMLRVVKPTGMILWYDYWLNPTNPETKGIRRSEVRSLFPDCIFRFKRITLAPPLSRWLAKYSWISCEFLESLRFLNTHYLASIRPAGTQ
jgi:ubiquinone/menaquinone biosynthesis C-methylase UbiE